MSVFSTSPGALLLKTLFKKFYSHWAVGRTIGEAEAVAKGRIWPRGSSGRAQADLQFSAPQAGHRSRASSRDGVRGGLGPGCCSWGHWGDISLRWHWGDISGAVLRGDSAQHHSALGGCGTARGNLVLIWKWKPPRAMLWLSAHPHHGAPPPPREFLLPLIIAQGEAAFPLPSFSLLFWVFFF